jgi:Tyrosyl-DNA phosphodiesterase
MYIQDFPRKLTQQSPEDLPQFAKDVLFYIKAQNIPIHILNKFCEYDFIKSAGIEFVQSMSGEHFDELERHSKNGLASAVKRLGFKPEQGQTLQLSYVVRNPILTVVYLTPVMSHHSDM